MNVDILVTPLLISCTLPFKGLRSVKEVVYAYVGLHLLNVKYSKNDQINRFLFVFQFY